jgi:hypothetical protein
MGDPKSAFRDRARYCTQQHTSPTTRSRSTVVCQQVLDFSQSNSISSATSQTIGATKRSARRARQARTTFIIPGTFAIDSSLEKRQDHPDKLHPECGAAFYVCRYFTLFSAPFARARCCLIVGRVLAAQLLMSASSPDFTSFSNTLISS